ncbi:hypothetical protein LOZ58_006001 [Ophidiomyces ophidiicola]|nr:hypothetical protein LOZ65_002823 [Ophidiomyces ophidiicola]KAI1939909.1 hypothetical protein LOZ66_002342 [Ophidiomyces ophidiicola]KAI1956869.1 hypothetical protein LOZ58_006001 [Ophidiomyces ophidiicola]
MARLHAIKTSYRSKSIHIPARFLTTTPPDAKPITFNHIDFATSPLHEYKDHYAVVLDNVLSPSECDELLSLAEQSVEEPGDDPWKPALVNVGAGHEVLHTDYRNSDRIIWDNETVVSRLLSRCFQADGIKERVSIIAGTQCRTMLGKRALDAGERWRIVKLNDRMRFLRYGKGQFFRPHCDGAYATETQRTFYTLHLYLNGPTDANPLRGGATTFWSSDEKRRVDVHPKTGSVLIFQHRGLLHSGDDVLEGIKYTMRSDIMYERDYIEEQ